jgi:hypothetical protein
MRPVSSRLILAVAGIAGLTLAGAQASASPGGHHGGFSHSRGHVVQARAGHGGGRGMHIRTVGRGYGAGDFGRGSLGRGFGSGDHFGRHGRFGRLGLGYGFGDGFGYGGTSYGYDRVIRSAYGDYAPDSACCFEAYPTASGIRAAPVAPPAIYVIGGRGRHGHLRRPVRGEWLEADSALAGYPSRVVSPSGARIIRIP